ncbi:MAG: hypothetical protein KUG77_02945, partial [Nannocystaceae bacterium]|nr:hypothetical protein [Nannocystaceae bacterium]
PRWIERRGFTLCPAAQEGHYVRLSLMERVGLVGGLFNVREARARQIDAHQAPQLLSAGRGLSWRWLREPEAQRLLDERLGTLQTMGYTILGSEMGTRGRWDWLYDLVHRRLAEPQVQGERSRSPGDALRDALSTLGLSPDDVLEGLASVLGISISALRDPDAPTVQETDSEQIAVLLPFLIHHERPEIRQVGERWFACPRVLYQLPPDTIARWLESDAELDRTLAPRLEDEGPALLGPQRLLRLSKTGQPRARAAAQRWASRMG